ncbi:hypothetical protein Tco_0273968 [Tanacetum coccineum]
MVNDGHGVGRDPRGERDRLIVMDRGTRSVPLFVDSERDHPIVVDHGTHSVPLFVMLSVTISIWFVARVGPLSGKDPLVIVVADTDRLPHVCCGSALSACVLKHPGRSQLISGLSGSSLRLRDTSASSAAICFFRGYLLLRDVSLYLLDIKSVLTQKGLDIFCHKFYIPEDVHPQLPSPNQMTHEMLVGKIGVYTRFFEYANFRLPLFTFLVNVLRHFRINLSQLSVIAAAKVSHFEILCRVHNIEPTVGLFCCFYVNSKNKRWMSFSKRSDSDANVFRDPFPKSNEFNADDYAVLVAHPAPFRKFPEPFLCLIRMSRYYTLDEDTYPSFLHDDETEMDLFAFIHVVDPTKVKVVERERAEREKNFWNPPTDQGDSAVDGGHDAEIELVTGAENISAKNVIAERPKRQRKKRQAVTDTSGSSHPPKKLRGDNKTSSGAATGDKSSSILKELLASSILNVEVGVDAVATLPLVTSLVSTTPGCEGGNPTDSITGLNLCTVGPSKRSIVLPPVMTEAVVTSHAASDPPIPVLEIVRPDVVGPYYSAKQDLSMGSQELNTETLHQVFVSQWNVLNDSLLDDYDVSREFVDHLAPPALFSQIREMDYHYLFMEFNVGTARQACLNAEARDDEVENLKAQLLLKEAEAAEATDDEVENLKAQLLLKETEAAEAARLRAQVFAVEATKKMHADEIDALKQRNVALENEKDSLDGKVTELQSLVSAKDLELKDLNVVVHALETTCSSLRDQVSGYERLKEQIEEFQDAQMNIVNDKVAKLDADLLKMALHLEEKLYPRLLTTISSRRWLLTRCVKLDVVKCLNLLEYLTDLGSAISCAIEKGMQNGLSADIGQEKAGRSLADVVAYNSVVAGCLCTVLDLEWIFGTHKVRYGSVLLKWKAHKGGEDMDVTRDVSSVVSESVEQRWHSARWDNLMSSDRFGRRRWSSWCCVGGLVMDVCLDWVYGSENSWALVCLWSVEESEGRFCTKMSVGALCLSLLAICGDHVGWIRMRLARWWFVIVVKRCENDTAYTSVRLLLGGDSARRSALIWYVVAKYKSKVEKDNRFKVVYGLDVCLWFCWVIVFVDSVVWDRGLTQTILQIVCEHESLHGGVRDVCVWGGLGIT